MVSAKKQKVYETSLAKNPEDSRDMREKHYTRSPTQSILFSILLTIVKIAMLTCPALKFSVSRNAKYLTSLSLK
jgi:hypothetical protein